MEYGSGVIFHMFGSCILSAQCSFSRSERQTCDTLKTVYLHFKLALQVLRTSYQTETQPRLKVLCLCAVLSPPLKNSYLARCITKQFLAFLVEAACV